MLNEKAGLIVFFADGNASPDFVDSAIDELKRFRAMSSLGALGMVQRGTGFLQGIEGVVHVALVGACVLDQNRGRDNERDYSDQDGC